MAHVLVCEDDEGVRNMMNLMLMLEGHEAEFITDGGSAIARLAGPAPDLVILDVMMPGANGYEVLENLRTTAGWEAIPVVLCTALTGDEDQWRGWSAGADYVLTKPFDADDLRDIVLRLLSRTTA